MTWLVTGIEGFVGSHLFEFLQKKGEKVIGTARNQNLLDKKNVMKMDLLSLSDIKNTIKKTQPKKIALLAGFSSLRESFDKKKECLAINHESTRNILIEVEKCSFKPKILTISSAMIYCPSTEPLTENSPICNTSPYVDAKIRQEKLIDEFSDLEILSARSFNVIGPGQKVEFIVSKLAKAFADASAAGKSSLDLELGDIQSERDFLDVRDICSAYTMLLEKKTSHRIYNVCSASTHSVSEIIDILKAHTTVNVNINQTGGNTKKGEPTRIIGDNSRLWQDISWKPKIAFQQSVLDVFEYWRNKQ